jgi:hypothetical protein
MQMNNDIFSSITNDDEEASLLVLHAIANERGDPRIPVNWLVLDLRNQRIVKHTQLSGPWLLAVDSCLISS